MKKSPFFYSAIRSLIKPSITLFYRRIQAEGLDNLQQDRPMILAVNHHNAFLDAFCALYFVKNQSYSAVRADVFSNKFVRFLFYNFGMVPVYRIQDGYDKLGKNEETFGRMKEVIGEGHNLLIFPEATHSASYLLKPLRKGLARLSAELLKDGVKFSIVPVGLFFTERYGIRGDVLVRYGAPLACEDMKYEPADHVKFINGLTANIQERMTALLPSLPTSDDYNKTATLISKLCDTAPEAPVAQIIKALEMAIEKDEDKAMIYLKQYWPKEPSPFKNKLIRLTGNTARLFLWPLIAFNHYISRKITDDIVFRQSLTYSNFTIASPIYFVLVSSIIGLILGPLWGWVAFAALLTLSFAYLKSKDPGIRN